MKKILITICLFLLAPSVGLAACYSASGFGTAGVDGTYTDSGTTFNGQIVYTNGNGKSLFAQDNPNQFWAIDNTGWTTGGVNYYVYQSPFSTPDTGSWVAQTGASPAGTITSVSCGGGSGTTTPNTLTTTTLFTLANDNTNTTSSTTLANITTAGLDLINNILLLVAFIFLAILTILLTIWTTKLFK